MNCIMTSLQQRFCFHAYPEKIKQRPYMICVLHQNLGSLFNRKIEKKILIKTFVYFRFSMIYWRVLSEWWLSVQYENRDWILALVQNRQKEETRKTALPFTRKRRSKKSTFNSIFHNTWWTLLNRKNIFRTIYRNNLFCTLT